MSAISKLKPPPLRRWNYLLAIGRLTEIATNLGYPECPISAEVGNKSVELADLPYSSLVPDYEGASLVAIALFHEKGKFTVWIADIDVPTGEREKWYSEINEFPSTDEIIEKARCAVSEFIERGREEDKNHG